MIIITTVITRSGCPSCPKSLQAPGHPDTQVSGGDHRPRHDSLGQAYRGDSPVPTQPNHQLNQNINSTMQCVSRSDTRRYNFVQSINISATQHEHVCQDPDMTKQVHFLCLNAIYSLLEFSTISRYTVMYVTYPNCSENVQKT